jgi:hypothetical protein
MEMRSTCFCNQQQKVTSFNLAGPKNCTVGMGLYSFIEEENKQGDFSLNVVPVSTNANSHNP